MQQCTGHWNPFAGRRPALGHGVPGRSRLHLGAELFFSMSNCIASSPRQNFAFEKMAAPFDAKISRASARCGACQFKTPPCKIDGTTRQPIKDPGVYKLAWPRTEKKFASICHAITDPPVTKTWLWASFWGVDQNQMPDLLKEYFFDDVRTPKPGKS